MVVNFAMPLFRWTPKTPQELVKSLRDAFAVLTTAEGGAKKADKVGVSLTRYKWVCLVSSHMRIHFFFFQAADEAAKVLVLMKNLLYGTGEQDPQAELAAQLAQEFYNHDTLLHMVKNLHRLDFEVCVEFVLFMCKVLTLLLGQEGCSSDMQ